MKESEIFLACSQIENPELRSKFLESICKGDTPLRSRIEKLLEEYFRFQSSCDDFPDSLQDRLQSIKDPENSKERSSSLLDVGSKVGRYEILSCLGVGGMGEVYLAHDSQLDRKAALKILPARYTQNPKWIQRFEREAKAASALNHPNLLTIYEIGKSGQLHYIASELIEGITLRAQLAKPGKLRKRLDYVIQVAEGLHRAHSAGIIHRDIKPENIMVRYDGIVKVLDFGIATIEPNFLGCPNAGYQTEVGVMMGTIPYMSPEQARREELDHRSDLFSLGIVLHELVTGSLPYHSQVDTQVLMELTSPQALRLGQMPSGCPSELEGVIRKLLRKDREYRYQSAKEVAVDIKEIRNQLDMLAESPLTVTSLDTDIDSNIHNFDSFTDPEVRYARSGDVNIAYQVMGKGELDLVFVMGWVSHLDWFWKDPSFKKFLQRLASFSRLILFDKRGTGLSDRVPYDQLPTLEQRMDDVRAVMEAVGSEQAILCGISEGGPLCTLFAATYPQKTLALIMMGSYARRLRADDYPWGPTEEQHALFLEEIRNKWGGPVGIEARAPSQANNPAFREWWGTYLRMGASPGAALALTRMNSQIDIRPILKTIQVPTLVLHRSGDMCLRVDEGRFLAEQIPGAKFVELPGNDHLPFVGQQDEFLDPIQEFLTGVRHDPMVDRVLATVLYVYSEPSLDPNSTGKSLSQTHFQREVELFRGRHVQTTEEIMSAAFDGPARAIRASIAIRDSAARLGVPIKIGIHTGECYLGEHSARGPAYELAESVSEYCDWGEVLISSTVKDLVAGAGLQFALKDRCYLSEEIPECNLYRVV